ncbi:hypothetical protein ANAPH2_00574 [Anaplasma phagocytophilum]|nr:hypothetical protein ANAPH2_00574 [Anaplasma phagocytophilum]
MKVEETALISTTSPPSIVLANNPATMVFSSEVSFVRSPATALALSLVSGFGS